MDVLMTWGLTRLPGAYLRTLYSVTSAITSRCRGRFAISWQARLWESVILCLVSSGRRLAAVNTLCLVTPVCRR